MPDWLADILQWIRDNPDMAGLTIGLVAFLEGLALVGILIPGIIILFGFGTLIGLGVLDLASVWVWCSVGAILGDGISFWIGYYFKDHLRDIWPFNRFSDLIDQGEQFFKRHGLKSILIGRFVGPVRPVMPVVAGMLSMDIKRYVPANILAGILWAPAYLLPGVVFGASIELAKAVALRLALLLVLGGALAWGISWIINRSYNYLLPRSSKMLAYALRWSQRHPHLGRFARPLVDPTRPESGTLALFAFSLIIGACGLLYLSIALPIAGGVPKSDQYLLSVFASLRTPWADASMLFFSGLGDIQVLLPASGLVLIWLLWRRRWLAFNHWLAALGFGFLLSVGIQQVLSLALSRSIGSTTSADLTSSHFTMSVVVYGFFAVLIGRELPSRRRVWPYVLTAFLVTAIAFSRLYFAAHWPSDMLAGLFAGVLWVAILGIAYRRRIRRPYWMAPPTAIFFFGIFVASTLYGINRELPDQLKSHLHIQQRIEQSIWHQQGINGLEPQQSFLWATLNQSNHNLEIAGTLQSIEHQLVASGWESSEKLNWSFIFQMLQPNPSQDSLALLPASYRGQREALLMRKTNSSNEQTFWVLRIWPSHISLKDGTPLWVGRVGIAQQAKVLYFFSYWQGGIAKGVELIQVTKDLPMTFRSLNIAGRELIQVFNEQKSQ